MIAATTTTTTAIIQGECTKLNAQSLTTPRTYGYYSARIWQITISEEIEMSIKVTVNLPDETVNAIKSIAAAQGTTVTEALRQVIETQYFLRDEMQKGNNLLLQDPRDKSLRQVVFSPSPR